MNGGKALVVNYLSLDAEGHDMAALRGVDWGSFNINVLTVEGSEIRERPYMIS